MLDYVGFQNCQQGIPKTIAKFWYAVVNGRIIPHYSCHGVKWCFKWVKHRRFKQRKQAVFSTLSLRCSWYMFPHQRVNTKIHLCPQLMIFIWADAVCTCSHTKRLHKDSPVPSANDFYLIWEFSCFGLSEKALFQVILGLLGISIR